VEGARALMEPQLQPQQELQALESQARPALSYSLAIEAFPETIFECIDDADRQRGWISGLERTVFPDGRPAGNQAGTRFLQLVRQRGGLVQYEGMILLHQPSRRLVVRVGNRHLTSLVDYRLTSLGRSSRLDYSCRQIYRTLLGRMTGGLLVGSSRSVALDQLVALKLLAEAGG
jgi:hypothetical protein